MTSGSSQGVVHLTTVHSLGAIKFRRLPITPHSLRVLDIYFTLILCASLSLQWASAAAVIGTRPGIKSCWASYCVSVLFISI
jgi:hypothetical protein